MSNRDTRLQQAQIRCMFNAPFFAPGVARLPVIWDNSIDTAATNGKRIIWNTKFFDSLTDHQIVTVLCHEVAHCLLGHIWRIPPGTDPGIWNQAIDHATNLMLKEFSALQTAKNKADPFPFPDPPDSYLADPRYNGWAEEQVLRDLLNQPTVQVPVATPSHAPAKGGSRSATAKVVVNSPSAPSKSTPSPVVQAAPVPKAGNPAPAPAPKPANQALPQPNQGGKKVQSTQSAPKTPVMPSKAQGGASPNRPRPHSMPAFGGVEVAKPGQTPDKALRNDWRNTLIQSVAAMKQRGDLPASIKRFVDELVSPRVPWPELLRSWLREQCAEDWDWRSPCMEMSDSGFILPSLKSERMGPVIFGSDWSGSTHNLIGLFHSEKQSALDSLRPERLIDIGFDTKVAWEKEYFPGDTILPEVACGGGTCFKDFFRRCSELSPPPKCAVVLTDMDGTMPDAHPPFPVIWCSTEKDRSAPFGQVIYVGV